MGARLSASPDGARPPPRTARLQAGAAQLLQRNGRSWNSPGAWVGVKQTPTGRRYLLGDVGAPSLGAACGWRRVGSPPSPAGCARGGSATHPHPRPRPPRAREHGLWAVRWGRRDEGLSPHPCGRGASALGDTHACTHTPLHTHLHTVRAYTRTHRHTRVHSHARTHTPAVSRLCFRFRPEVTDVPTCLVLGASGLRVQVTGVSHVREGGLAAPGPPAHGLLWAWLPWRKKLRGSGPPPGQPSQRVGRGDRPVAP